MHRRVGRPAAVSVCSAASGTKQSGRTERSAGDGAGRTLVKSRETDQENGYENRSPVFSYERSPTDCHPHHT